MADSEYKFTTTRPWDHQPGLWVTTTLSAIYSLLVFAGRWTIRRKFSYADVAIVIAYLLASASWVALYIGLFHGAGKTAAYVGSAEYNFAGKAVFASNILLILAKGMASCSQNMHLWEILSSSKHKRVCLVAAASCCFATITAALCVSAGCSPENTLNTGERASCGQGTTRWAAAATLILVETTVPSLLPLYLFRQLQVPLRTKLRIFGAFSFPLLNIAMVIVTLWQYASSTQRKPSGTGLVNFEIALQVNLCWSLICPTIPCMRPMAIKFTTGGVLIGGSSAATSTPADRYATATTSHVSATRRSRFRQSKALEQDEFELRPDIRQEGNYTTIGTSNEEEKTSLNSWRSNQHGIQKQQEFRVSTENVVEPM